MHDFSHSGAQTDQFQPHRNEGALHVKVPRLAENGDGGRSGLREREEVPVLVGRIPGQPCRAEER